jgi:putative ABC transport system substrate-binding protein
MRRREFMAVLGSVAALPLVARAQQASERIRRIGVLIALSESDPEGKVWIDTFRTGLKALGWIEGENARIDYRFAPAGPASLLARADEVIE